MNRLVKVVGMASVVVAGVAGCGSPETVPRAAAHLTFDGTSRNTRPPACSRVADEKGQWQTIDIVDHEGKVEAVVVLSADRAIPKWVKFRNVDGFNGSAWAGGVGETHVDLVNGKYTITGSAYGISSKNPNTTVTKEFKIVADC